MTTASPPHPMTPHRRGFLIAWLTVVAVVVVVIAFFVFAGLYADVLWYQQLGFSGVLFTEWGWGIGMFFVGVLGMGVPLWLSINLAHRLRPVYAKLSAQLDRYQQVVEPLRRFAMWVVPIVFGLFAGIASSVRWQQAAMFVNATPVGVKDPQFGIDDGFYMFTLPFLHSIVAFASAVLIICFLATIAVAYLYGSIRVNGRDVRIAKSARIQIAVIAAVYLLVQAGSVWLDRYSTVTDSNVNGLISGAAYADVNATVPARTILAGVAVFVAALFVVAAVIGRWRYPLIGVGLLIVAALVIGTIYPWAIQKLQVAPSAQTLETPYIQKAITATRAAYGVSDVTESTYQARTTASPGALRTDAQTTASIRIIDPTVVSPAFGQLQQYKQYYQFPDVLDVDRYSIAGKVQDTVTAVRSIDQSALGDSQNWFNDTLVYTHGYGLVAAAGNSRQPDGKPVFLEGGIPTAGTLPTYEPRVYFGENMPAYSIVGAAAGSPPIELDYPAGGNGAQATYNTYSGNGGPKLDSFRNRLAYALKFQSEQILLSTSVNADSQILYDRAPAQRVQKVAPYLTLDSNPYPSIVDGRLVWLIDGFTTSNDYPYSMRSSYSADIADSETLPQQYPVDSINYVRNSVKATVDAYTGAVTLYAWDPNDPVLQTWEKVFPTTVKPLSDMSGDLMSHVRYPEDLFKTQRAILANYHVTDPGQFFLGEDTWKVPDDPRTVDSSSLQPPYYLTMQVPGQKSPTYSLYSTYIPASSAGSTSRSVLKGYLAVDSDAGTTAGTVAPDYGTLRLLDVPAEDNVPGPGQVQANFENDSTISSQLNVLRVGGATAVVYGNLLTIPVGGGLLYVEPVYVQSKGTTSFPQLQEVMVAFGENIAMEPTLDAALDKLFGGNSGASAGDQGVAKPGTTSPGTTTPGTTAPTGSNAALQKALAAAQQAFSDAQAALKNGDWTAYGNAQAALQAAIQAAVAAENSGK